MTETLKREKVVPKSLQLVSLLRNELTTRSTSSDTISQAMTTGTAARTSLLGTWSESAMELIINGRLGGRGHHNAWVKEPAKRKNRENSNLSEDGLEAIVPVLGYAYPGQAVSSCKRHGCK